MTRTAEVDRGVTELALAQSGVELGSLWCCSLRDARQPAAANTVTRIENLKQSR